MLTSTVPHTLDMSRPLTVEEVDKQIPRQYQNEIFTHAQKGNVITVMDTGTGKTLVAITLIKWITTRVSTNPGDPKTVVVFIVPKVPLVEQQRDAITQQSNLTVRGYYGALDVDYWKREQWAKEFTETDVLVMTPQVFYDLLSHAHWSIDKVSLLIFDEAHHCRKNNPYNQIMRDHYHKCDPQRRPKVFGMTASPIWNVKNPQDSLRELERNMDCKVLAVRVNVDELTRHAPKPTEEVLEYEPTPEHWLDYPHPSMRIQLDLAEMLGLRDSQGKSFKTRHQVTQDCLGIVGAEYFLCTVVPQEIDSLVREKRRESTTTRKLIASGADLSSKAAAIDEHVTALEDIKTIVVEHSACVFTQSLDIPPMWLSPRMVILAQLLERSYTADPLCQCIIFAEQRQVVMVMCWILRHIPSLRAMIRPTFVTGHGGMSSRNKKTEEDIKGMSVKEQQAAIRAFREGKANLLVATSVAEEGLDFQPCNLVIRFDALKTMVSYAQSRGRARQKASKYVIMHPIGPSEAAEKYTIFLKKEPELKQSYQKRIDQTGEQDDEEGYLVSETDLRLREVYTTSTGAVLTYGNAISLLSRLCAVLPIEAGIGTLRPVYVLRHPNPGFFGFSYALTLPSALPLPRCVLHREGGPRSTKKEAKRAVAFDAARGLHQLGCFDDYLLPLQDNTDNEGQDADGEQFKPLDVPDIFESTVLDVWSDPWRFGQELLCYPLLVGNVVTAGLVTCAHLDVEDVNDHSGLKTALPGLGQPVVLQFSSEEHRRECMQVMQGYTLFVRCWAISRRPVDVPLACFFVQLTTDYQPNYLTMKLAMESPLSLDWRRDQQDGVRMIVINKLTGTRPYSLLNVRDDVTPSTPFASYGRQCCEENCATFAQHIETTERKTALRLSQKALASGKPVKVRPPSSFPPLSPIEPMVEISLAKLAQSNPDSEKELVPSSFIKSVAIDYGLFRAAEMLPALVRHVSSTFRARAVQRVLSLPRYPTSFFAEALAIPGAVLRYNYNRLEFLGDTFLKIATSIHIFNKYPHRHEGQLAALRQGSVRNAYLRVKAYRAGIHHFTVGEQLRAPRRWLPPTTEHTIVEEGTAVIKADVPRRCLSDCVESLLGASYLAGGLTGMLTAGTSMGLCFGGNEPWTSRYINDYPWVQTSTGLKVLEDKLGYKFRNPLLLLEAVTHPTFPESQTPSYQRLEFLGDAVIEVYVIEYLFLRYPSATAHQLSWMKHLLVCNSILGAVAIRELALDKQILFLSARLGHEIEGAVRDLKRLSYAQLAAKWWEYDPPKALNDVLEAILGAVLVDCNYDLGIVNPVVGRVFKDTLPLAHPGIPLHPVMELYIWAGKNGCDKVHFEKSRQREESLNNDTSHVFVHETEIISSTQDSINVAKCFASYAAMAILSDPQDAKALKKLCNCADERLAAALLRQQEKLRKQQERDDNRPSSPQHCGMDIDSDEEAVEALVSQLQLDDWSKRGRLDDDAEEAEVEQIVAALLDDPINAATAAAMGSAKDETDDGFAKISRALLAVTEDRPLSWSSDEEDEADRDENPAVVIGQYARAADGHDEAADMDEDTIVWPPRPSASVRTVR